LSAVQVDFGGVEQEAILENGIGSQIPGAFFTLNLLPDPVEAVSIAYSFALRKEPPHAVMLGTLPKTIFDGLRASGQVLVRPLPGDYYDETVFLPPSFPVLNMYNQFRWGIIPLP